jgi:hypothetical protein
MSADNKFAPCALARGDDPEVIIQRIADYRAEDKDNPAYYARLTVQKAHAELAEANRLGSIDASNQTSGKAFPTGTQPDRN